MKYSGLSSTEDGYINLQFKKSPPKFPNEAIMSAIVLFLIGTFFIGSQLLMGYISKEGDRLGHSGPQHWHSGTPVGILLPMHHLLCVQRLQGLPLR